MTDLWNLIKHECDEASSCDELITQLSFITSEKPILYQSYTVNVYFIDFDLVFSLPENYYLRLWIKNAVFFKALSSDLVMYLHRITETEEFKFLKIAFWLKKLVRDSHSFLPTFQGRLTEVVTYV